jgi:hypothetical protein
MSVLGIPSILALSYTNSEFQRGPWPGALVLYGTSNHLCLSLVQLSGVRTLSFRAFRDLDGNAT